MDQRRPPVGHVRRIERRLEELVLEDEPLLGAEALVGESERLGKTLLPPTDVVLAGVVGAVGEPQLEVLRPSGVHDVDALEQVVDRLLAHAAIRVADASQHVVVVLERVRVDRAEANATLRGVARQGAVIVDLVPWDVERDRRRDAGVPMDLGRVGHLLVGIARHALLREHLEPRPRVAERPGGQLDPVRGQPIEDGRLVRHVQLQRRRPRDSPFPAAMVRARRSASGRTGRRCRRRLTPPAPRSDPRPHPPRECGRKRDTGFD